MSRARSILRECGLHVQCKKIHPCRRYRHQLRDRRLYGAVARDAAGDFPMGNTPEAFAKFLREELVKWGKSGEDHLGMTIFASLTTFFHFAVSLLIRSKNSSGGPPASSSPSRSSPFFFVSVFSTFATSRFQRMAISLGMPLGPHIPYQRVP